MRDHIRDGAEIYRRSFATIRAEADLAGLPVMERVAVRMIHACGMVDLTARPVGLPRRRGGGARGAARRRADPVRRDDGRLAGSPARGCPPATRWSARSATPRAGAAPSMGTTRSAAALELWRPTGSRAPWWPSATRRPRCSGCWRWSRRAPAGRPRSRAAGGLRGRGRVQGRPGRAPGGLETWWCTAAVAAAPWPSPPSTRSRARPNERRHAARGRPRARRPGAGHGQGRAAASGRPT